MLTIGAIAAAAATVVLVALSTAMWWRLRRCPCQREAPLASLGALREVTARARREQVRGATSPGPGPPGHGGGIGGLRLTPRPPT